MYVWLKSLLLELRDNNNCDFRERIVDAAVVRSKSYKTRRSNMTGETRAMHSFMYQNNCYKLVFGVLHDQDDDSNDQDDDYEEILIADNVHSKLKHLISVLRFDYHSCTFVCGHF